MFKSITYTEPVLCHYNHDLKKSWFIYFSVTNQETKQTIRKQIRGGINSFTTKKDRLKRAAGVIVFWSDRLQSGWHPFEVEKPADDVFEMSFAAALDFGLSKCQVSTNTARGYKCTVKFIKAAAEGLQLSEKPLKEIKRLHIKLILEKCQASNKWSNKSYNKHLGYLKAIITRIVNWEIIENNPAHKISELPTTESEKYVPYTAAERKAITDHLFINHYLFFVYLQLIYHTGIRPKEILALKIKDVDLVNQEIKIVPEIELENSKTKSIRKVPINNHLLPFLRELQLNNHSKEFFVFGSPYQSGKGNKGSAAGKLSGAMHPDYFKPSNTMIKRDTVTKFWKRVVMDKLGIQKHLYAAKHSGANAMIEAGIDLDSLKEMYGHSSKLMTEKYASQVKKVRFNEIIEKAAAF